MFYNRFDFTWASACDKTKYWNHSTDSAHYEHPKICYDTPEAERRWFNAQTSSSKWKKKILCSSSKFQASVGLSAATTASDATAILASTEVWLLPLEAPFESCFRPPLSPPTPSSLNNSNKMLWLSLSLNAYRVAIYVTRNARRFWAQHLFTVFLCQIVVCGILVKFFLLD